METKVKLTLAKKFAHRYATKYFDGKLKSKITLKLLMEEALINFGLACIKEILHSELFRTKGRSE